MDWNIDWRVAARHTTIEGDRICINPVVRLGMQTQFAQAVAPAEESAAAATALQLTVLLQLLRADTKFAEAFEQPHPAVGAALAGRLGTHVAEELRAVYNAQNKAVAPPSTRLITAVAVQVRTRDPGRLFSAVAHKAT